MPRRRPDAPPSDGAGGTGPERFVEIVVQPRASRTEVVGRQGNALKIVVAAPPVGGPANEELTRFVAKRCGVPRSAVRIAAGAKGRRKRIAVEGLAAAEVAGRLLDGG